MGSKNRKNTAGKSGSRIYPLEPMQPGDTCAFERTATDLFVLFNGIRIARRGHPDTPHARQWVALEPGYAVRTIRGGRELVVEYLGQRVH